jgi:hypothetical protein
MEFIKYDFDVPLPMELKYNICDSVEPDLELATLFQTDGRFCELLFDVAYHYQGFAVIMMMDDFSEYFPGRTGDRDEIVSRFTYCWKERATEGVNKGRKMYMYDELEDFNYGDFVDEIFKLLQPILHDKTQSYPMYGLVKKYIGRYERAINEWDSEEDGA